MSCGNKCSKENSQVLFKLSCAQCKIITLLQSTDFQQQTYKSRIVEVPSSRMMEAIVTSEISVPSIEPQGLTSQKIISLTTKKLHVLYKGEGVIYPLLKYGSAANCMLSPAPFTVRLFLKYRIKDVMSASQCGWVTRVLMVTYSDTSANEDNLFRNHIRQPKSSLVEN